MRFLIALLSILPFGATALAAQPEPGAINFQPAATRIAERIHNFHFGVLVIITIITLFVLALLIWVCLRYNKRANPVAHKFSHNTVVEIVWTVVPVIILVSLPVLPSRTFSIRKTSRTLRRSRQWKMPIRTSIRKRPVKAGSL